jgi:hypothetical protein
MGARSGRSVVRAAGSLSTWLRRAVACAAALLLAGALAAQKDRSPFVPTPCSVADCKSGLCEYRASRQPVACSGGLCVFHDCDRPSCRGGLCTFYRCALPSCDGGKCSFVQPTTTLKAGFCKGGGCDIDGYALPDAFGKKPAM